MPIQGDTRLTIALERPGASADARRLRRTASSCRTSRRASRLPDLSGEYRMGGKWGYVEVAGILR